MCHYFHQNLWPGISLKIHLIFAHDGVLLQNTLPLEVVPLKIRTLGYAVSARSFFMFLKGEVAATWLRGYALSLFYVFKKRSIRYAATELRGCIKEQVRFMCSVFVSAHGLLFRHID